MTAGWFAGTLRVIDPDDLPELADALRAQARGVRRTRAGKIVCGRQHTVVAVWRTAVGLLAVGEDHADVAPLPGASGSRHRAVPWAAVLEGQDDDAVGVAQCRCARHEVPVAAMRAAVARGPRPVRLSVLVAAGIVTAVGPVRYGPAQGVPAESGAPRESRGAAEGRGGPAA